MSTQYLACFTAVDTTISPHETIAFHPYLLGAPNGIGVGDILINAIVLAQGPSGSIPVGTNVTNAFIGPVANIPQIEISEGTTINFSGNYMFQVGGQALGGYTILGVWERP